MWYEENVIAYFESVMAVRKVQNLLKDMSLQLNFVYLRTVYQLLKLCDAK
jgi:hypothetical protein